ncbi:inositol monophosphatase family protein [Seohaeicola nanhaiensis]|uniref:Inositol monophosphatase family protein n=1 Tax=Seohaeicola nanhaiensis TaxID=1387282 RepID=A0ABV9KHS5_9RHOB
MPAADLPLLIEAAYEAGRIARSFNGAAKSWNKPDDAGPVTEADLAVNDMLEETLQAARPDYGWLSEETQDTPARLSRERVFIVDPIDGTRSFVEGDDSWAHALAVTQNGIVTAGVVYLPMRDLLYAAALGQGATLNGQPIRPTERTDLASAEILATRPILHASNWSSGTAPTFRRAYRPSLAWRMALVAEGRFDGLLTMRRCWEWDIAAGDLILREAGAISTDARNAPLRFNNPDPVRPGLIAAGPGLHAQIAAAVRPPAA